MVELRHGLSAFYAAELAPRLYDAELALWLAPELGRAGTSVLRR